MRIFFRLGAPRWRSFVLPFDPGNIRGMEKQLINFFSREKMLWEYAVCALCYDGPSTP